MNYDLPVKLDTKKLDKCRVLTYSTSSDNADFTARNAHCIQEFGCAFEIVGVGVIGRIKLRTAEPDDVKNSFNGCVCLFGLRYTFCGCINIFKYACGRRIKGLYEFSRYVKLKGG